MHILITGGKGYIGRRLVNTLKNKHDITVVSKSHTIETDLYNDVQLDLFTTYTPKIYSQLNSPDVLIHLAWSNGFEHNNESHIHNVMHHIRFIELMLQGGLKHLAVAGTMHEVGYFVGEVNEYTPTNPQSFYGISKNFLRQTVEPLCKKYGATCQWLRIFYIYGDDKHNNSIFSKILAAAEQGQKTFHLNSGELLYDFINIDDLALQISSVIRQKEITGIINCCSGVPISLKTMVNNFVSENNIPISIEYGKFPLRSYDSRAIWGNTAKINHILSKK